MSLPTIKHKYLRNQSAQVAGKGGVVQGIFRFDNKGYCTNVQDVKEHAGDDAFTHMINTVKKNPSWFVEEKAVKIETKSEPEPDKDEKQKQPSKKTRSRGRKTKTSKSDD